MEALCHHVRLRRHGHAFFRSNFVTHRCLFLLFESSCNANSKVNRSVRIPHYAEQECGLVAGCAETAARAAFLRTVLRLGVPRCLPPRLSPGFDPLGIAMFATFAISLDRFFRTLRSLLLLLSLNSASLELGGTAHLRNHLKESLDRPLVVSRGVVQVSAANPEHRSDRGNEPDTPDARNDFHLR
jgi:hypothetical protein